jgi:surface antigen
MLTMFNEVPLVVLLLALSGCAGTQGTSGYAGKPSCQKLTTQAEINGKVEPVTGVACQQSDGTWQFMQNTDRPYYGYPYAYYDPWYWGPYGFFGADFIFIDRDHHHHHHFDHGSMMHQGVAAGAGAGAGTGAVTGFHGRGMGGMRH